MPRDRPTPVRCAVARLTAGHTGFDDVRIVLTRTRLGIGEARYAVRGQPCTAPTSYA